MVKLFVWIYIAIKKFNNKYTKRKIETLRHVTNLSQISQLQPADILADLADFAYLADNKETRFGSFGLLD